MTTTYNRKERWRSMLFLLSRMSTRKSHLHTCKEKKHIIYFLFFLSFKRNKIRNTCIEKNNKSKFYERQRRISNHLFFSNCRIGHESRSRVLGHNISTAGDNLLLPFPPPLPPLLLHPSPPPPTSFLHPLLPPPPTTFPSPLGSKRKL